MASRSSDDGIINHPNMILYLDIDAFLPSVEQARFPGLRGKPVVVGSGVVASASYEARKYGIYAGMPISTATTLCPDVIVLKGHRPTYQAFAQEIFDLCRQISPVVEIEFDEIYCDIGCPCWLRHNPLRLAEDLKQSIRESTHLNVSIGIASNRMVARLVGKDAKPDGIGIVAVGEEEKFMELRRIGDIPGIAHNLVDSLAAIGITRVKDLKILPVSHLRAIFGNGAYLIYERLRGRDPTQFASKQKSISRETSFENYTIDIDRIEATLAYLVERACRTARMLRLMPGRISIKVRYADWGLATSSRKISCSRLLDRSIMGIASDLLKPLIQNAGIRLVGVSLKDLADADSEQGDLFDSCERARLERLHNALDTIRLKFGHSSVITGKSINLIDVLERDTYGYILRTPSLTK